MRIIWIRGLKKSKQSTDNAQGESPSGQHDECIKQFTLPQPEEEPDDPEDIVKALQTSLIPIKGIKLAKNSQN